MKVRCIPSAPRWLGTFYIGNLVRGLQGEGISFSFSGSRADDFLSGRWLRTHSDEVQLLHFHWTHHHYTRETWLQSMVELAKYAAKIALARRLGYRIVWTMHNYMPHERRYPLLHYLDRLLMAQLADTVIVHCDRARQLLERRLFRRRNVLVIPLGNFGEYVERCDRSQARLGLGIPAVRIMLLYFGMIRTYKGVPDLLRAFRQVDDENLVLAIVGQPVSDELAQEVTSLAADDPRVLTRLEHLRDAELSLYLSAADVAVLPYRNILTSGAAILALSFGLPVVAPRMGCLPELVGPECGLLYDPQTESLAPALEQLKTLDLGTMSHGARTRATEVSWSSMVQETAKTYRRTLRRTGTD